MFLFCTHCQPFGEVLRSPWLLGFNRLLELLHVLQTTRSDPGADAVDVRRALGHPHRSPGIQHIEDVGALEGEV